jgi:hypothetical protein
MLFIKWRSKISKDLAFKNESCVVVQFDGFHPDCDQMLVGLQLG